MSSAVNSYNCMIYNEYDKPILFSDPAQNVFGFTKVFANSQPEINPVIVSLPKPNLSSSDRKIPDNSAVRNNLAAFAERLNSVTNEHDAAGNMNIYNKCVFLVNGYNNNSLQDTSRSLGQITKSLDDSSKLNPSQQVHDELPFNFGAYNFILPHNESIPVAELLSRIENDTTKVSDFVEEPIVVNDSDDEPIVIVQQTEPDQNLYFVENDDLKPILSPTVKPGVYKKISPQKKIGSNSKLNVFRDVREKNGKILSAKDFQASYTTDCNIAIRAGGASEAENCVFNDAIQEGNTIIQEVQNYASGTPSGSGDSLWHLAHEILKLPTDNGNLLFNREKNELIYRNPSTKKKIIYRIVQPEELNIGSNDNNGIIKLGNPAFIQCFNDSRPNQTSPSSIIPKKQTQGRQRKLLRKRPATIDVQKHVQSTLPVAPTSRTRCGRISKPPQHIQNNFKISNDTANQPPIYESIKDCDYKFNKAIIPLLSADENVNEKKTKRERNIPAEYRCNVCNKIYLGRIKMLRHYESFPDHSSNSTVQQCINETSLYTFLVKKIQQPNLTEDQRISMLLNELTDFVDQVQSRSSHLFTDNSAIYFVNSRVSKLLGISEGHFGVDINALHATPVHLPRTINVPVFSAPPPPRLDYNLSISLDDTITDAKLNLSENMITSDDSLLRTVDDLVKEGIKNLTEDDGLSRCPEPSVIHYDHASDNAVEAVSMKETQPTPILDLSLDLFQFNSN